MINVDPLSVELTSNIQCLKYIDVSVNTRVLDLYCFFFFFFHFTHYSTFAVLKVNNLRDIYRIGILPKNPNFKKITKILNLMP